MVQKIIPMDVKYGDGSFALRQADWIDARVLAANVAESHTVPSYTDSAGATKYASYVVFSANADFYAKVGAAAAVPAADVTDGTGSELNPTIRFLAGATAIGVITAAAGGAIVTMMFYK